jgi:hypothetical protein
MPLAKEDQTALKGQGSFRPLVEWIAAKHLKKTLKARQNPAQASSSELRCRNTR